MIPSKVEYEVKCKHCSTTLVLKNYDEDIKGKNLYKCQICGNHSLITCPRCSRNIELTDMKVYRINNQIPEDIEYIVV